FHVMHHWWENDIRKHHYREFSNEFISTDTNIIFQRKNFIAFGNKRIAVIDRKIYTHELPEKIKVDYVLLSNNAFVRLEQIMQMYECEKIIADGTNSYQNINRWKREAESGNFAFHSLANDGAVDVE